jgi:hypothetical protein
MRRAGAALFASAALAACGAPEYGELPARCSDGACPEGTTCIHGVCAKPGDEVPITVAELAYLRGADLRVVPQSRALLVTFQTYAYSAEGQGVVAVRVDASGRVSRKMPLVTSFQANEGAVEPYYDVQTSSGGDLLVAIAASPLDDDQSTDPRLLTYRVDLPPLGEEDRGAQYAAAWPKELRMPSIGYGAVSSPRLLDRDDRVELGYFQTRTRTTGGAAETIGELAVFELDPDGALRGSPRTYPQREGLTVAVGVRGAFDVDGGVLWVLDDVRPSLSLIPDSNTEPASEGVLRRLAVPAFSDGAALYYIDPSRRTRDRLATDPVTGPASLIRRTLAGPGAGDQVVAELPPLRDTPAPVWIARDGDALLVSPGADREAPELLVFAVDAATGKARVERSIRRRSTLPLLALQAAVVEDKLFVVWAEEGPAQVSVRASIVDLP